MPSNYTAVPSDEPISISSRSPRLSSASGLPLPVTAGPPSFTSFSSGAAHTAPPSYPPPPSRRTLKGKGKATDQSSPNDDEESRLEGAEEGPAGMSFAIRFTDGSEDLLDFWCGSQESVGEVKRRVSRVDHCVRLAPQADGLIAGCIAIAPLPTTIPQRRRPTAALAIDPTRPPSHRRDLPRPLHCPAPLSPSQSSPRGDATESRSVLGRARSGGEGDWR